MKMSLLLMVCLVSAPLAHALGTTDCSDASGWVSYQYSSANRGIPPRPGDWQSSTIWSYKGSLLSDVETAFQKPATSTGPGVSVQYDESSRVVISGTPGEPGSVAYYAIKARISSSGLAGDLDDFLFCKQITPWPAP